MIIHSKFQIVGQREKRLDVLMRTPFIDRSEAEHVLCYYLLRNIEFTVYTLLGVRLLPYQELIIRTMLRRPNVLTIMSRGAGKTYLNAVYAALKSVISPGTKLLGIGSNRRQSRFIYKNIEDIANNSKASLFRQVVKKNADAPEESYFEICGFDSQQTSRLSFTPVSSGNRIRGFRANSLLVDEANIISEEIYNTVLRPMLAVSKDPVGKVLRLKKEKELIDAGIITKDDTIESEGNQVVMSSSAGYQFSFLYTKYKEYRDIILAAKISNDPKIIREASKYAVIQLSYEAIEIMSQGYLNMDSIESDRRTFPKDKFDTEYRAIFASDSGGFISRSLLESRQIEINSAPMVERKANPKDIYIMAVDPSSGQNETNDFFAIVILKLDVATKTAYCVNASASTGKGWPYYVKLVKQYIKDFDPVYVIIDSYGGGGQVASLITSQEFAGDDKDVKVLKTLDKDDITTYCHAENKILRMNIPTNQFNEASNTNLKSMLEHKLFWFAARIDEATHKAEAQDRTHADANIDKLDDATESIELAKSQIALIVGKQGINGLTTFGMPDGMSSIRKGERMRKDLYSATLLGAWAVKEYLDILAGPTKEKPAYNPTIHLA